MKIGFSNVIPYNNETYPQPQFKGRGTDLLNEWVLGKNLRAIRLNYYKEIVQDLSEGARLYFEKNKEIDNSVKMFHSCAGLTVFFDIPNNEILKISLENPLEFRRHRPEFDIPFLSPVEKYGKTYIVRQPKANIENITEADFKDVRKRIYSHGCELSRDGYRYEQYGIFNGKPYLIDTRCAMPMPSLYTMFIDIICKKLNKCYVFVNQEQGRLEKEAGIKAKGYFYYHSDETPRKSLTFKGGIIKLFNTVKNNIKYKKNNYCIPYEESKAFDYKIKKYYKM